MDVDSVDTESDTEQSGSAGVTFQAAFDDVFIKFINEHDEYSDSLEHLIGKIDIASAKRRGKEILRKELSTANSAPDAALSDLVTKWQYYDPLFKEATQDADLKFYAADWATRLMQNALGFASFVVSHLSDEDQSDDAAKLLIESYILYVERDIKLLESRYDETKWPTEKHRFLVYELQNMLDEADDDDQEHDGDEQSDDDGQQSVVKDESHAGAAARLPQGAKASKSRKRTSLPQEDLDNYSIKDLSEQEIEKGKKQRAAKGKGNLPELPEWWLGEELIDRNYFGNELLLFCCENNLRVAYLDEDKKKSLARKRSVEVLVNSIVQYFQENNQSDIDALSEYERSKTNPRGRRGQKAVKATGQKRPRTQSQRGKQGASSAASGLFEIDSSEQSHQKKRGRPSKKAKLDYDDMAWTSSKAQAPKGGQKGKKR